MKTEDQSWINCVVSCYFLSINTETLRMRKIEEKAAEQNSHFRTDEKRKKYRLKNKKVLLKNL